MPQRTQLSQPPLEVWGGIECTVNRIGDRYFDQLEWSGHYGRLDDLDRIATLGIRTLRVPLLWERIAPDGLAAADWSWTDAMLGRLRELGVRPIATLVHHGSGPRGTHLLDGDFAPGLANFAGEVASRYPWMRCDDLALGVLSPEDGWLDPNSVLQGFRKKARALGAEFVHVFTRLRQRTCPVLTFGGDSVAGAGCDGHRRAQPLRDLASGLGDRGRDRRGKFACLASVLRTQPGLTFGRRRPPQRISASANGIRAFFGGAHSKPRLHFGGTGLFCRGHRRLAVDGF